LDDRSRAADLLALVPAAAIPLVFLHARYQAETTVGPAHVYGSDVMIAITLAAALAAGVLYGWRPLARPRALWYVAGAFLLFLGISNFWRPIEAPREHLVTYAKIVEYALLAPAIVLLLRRRVQVERFLVVFVAWCAAAAGWGLLQFLGVVKEFEGYRPGQREVSFLGIYDFAVFAGATLAIALAAIAISERWGLVPVALVGGAVGMILAASVFAFLGIVLASALFLLVARLARRLTLRRALAIGGTLLVVGAGVAGLRGSDISDYLKFLGVHKAKTTTQNVETGPQRTMLAYIGLRIWQDHPWLGVGFDRSANRYQPYMSDVRRKFPQAEQAYPSPAHPWGVQDFWVQLLADGGLVGFALGIATFVTALVVALRARTYALLLKLVAAGWILVAAGTWIGEGIVAGIPLQAVTWLGFGLAAAVGGIE
jgi:hypothetical protein